MNGPTIACDNSAKCTNGMNEYANNYVDAQMHRLTNAYPLALTLPGAQKHGFDFFCHRLV